MGSLTSLEDCSLPANHPGFPYRRGRCRPGGRGAPSGQQSHRRGWTSSSPECRRILRTQRSRRKCWGAWSRHKSRGRGERGRLSKDRSKNRPQRVTPTESKEKKKPGTPAPGINHKRSQSRVVYPVRKTSRQGRAGWDWKRHPGFSIKRSHLFPRGRRL